MDIINYSKIKKLEGKVNQNDLDINERVKTDVPEGAEFTDTVTTINGNVGIIKKEDIVALGIPSQDTVIDISEKVDKVPGKGLSTNDYSNEEKQQNEDSHNNIGELSKLSTDEKGNLVGAIGEVKDDLVAHKENYVQQRQQDQFKVATVEKGLNDYQKTMASVNVNQEAKQKVTGYGTISLPKNTANGQVSVSVRGLSVTNLVRNGNFSNNLSNWPVNNPTGTTIEFDETLNIAGGKALKLTRVESSFTSVQQVITFDPSKKYFLSLYSKVAMEEGSVMSRIRMGNNNVYSINHNDNINLTRQGVKIDGSLVDRIVLGSTSYIVGSAWFGGIMISEITNEEFISSTENQLLQKYPYIDNTKSTVSASRIKGVGKNFFNKNSSKFTNDRAFSNNGGASINNYYNITSNYTPIEPNTVYSIQPTFDTSSINHVYYDKDFNIVGTILASPVQSIGFQTPSNARYMRFSLRKNVNANGEILQLEQNAVATPYEPYTESTQYIPNVGELRSLPNGTKDEISTSTNKLIKRVSNQIVINGEGDWRHYSSGDRDTANTMGFELFTTFEDSVSASSSGIGHFKINSNLFVEVANSNLYNYTPDDNTTSLAVGRLRIRMRRELLNGNETIDGLKVYLNSNPITLTYQLAEPIITPIQTSGNLISYPSGTIYVENVVADAGVYTTKFDIKDIQLPIKYIDKLIKYNFETGVQTVLDASLAVINADKKSFTHPSLTNKDMVFVDYFYDVEGTLGETTIEYLDSRHTIKDTTNDKFYSWDIKSTNGVPTVALTEVL